MNSLHSTPRDATLLADLWHLLGGPAAAVRDVTLLGPCGGLPSVYEVSALASASVAASLLAITELDGLRRGRPRRPIQLQPTHAAAVFRCERELKASGWSLPALWDPIAGDYGTADGFIRLHTNYEHHRHAALHVLGVEPTREAVAAALRAASAEAIEQAVVAAGGCAAALRSPEAWQAHPQGRAVARSPVFDVTTFAAATPSWSIPQRGRPLDGIRVLDLTRVIAGPVCTRLLAAYGADVLRIDPPGFAEVGALLAESTVGKRRATLDLRSTAGRSCFEVLVGQAQLIVHGYRSDALERLGFGSQRLRELNPALLIVSEDAYGFGGPWSSRRGFDSLVQMSCGIAWRGRQAAAVAQPVPLPVQALDHATGYLMAAASCRALSRLLLEQRASDVRLSLARTAKLLMDLGDGGDPNAAALTAEDIEPWLERAETGFGPVHRLRCPAGIEGIEPHWQRLAGPLGSDPASWEDG